jgi:signal transduction histidine kinase
MAASPGMPDRARAFVSLVIVAGAACVAFQLTKIGSFDGGDVAALVAVAAAVAAADQFTLTLPHGGETEHFALTDAVWIAALVLAAPGVLTLGAVAGTLAWQLGKRWALHKVAFNAGQVAIGLSLAEAVYGLGGRPDGSEPAAWALAAVAMLCCFAVNAVTVALIIALVQGEPFQRVLLAPWRVNVLHWLGNVSVGLLAAIVWQASPVGVLLLAVPMGLLYLAYRGWLESIVERDEMAQMASAADEIARDRNLSVRLPVGEREGRLPALAITLNRMLAQLDSAVRRERHLMRVMSENLRRPATEIATTLDRLGEAPCPEEFHTARRAISLELLRTSRILDDMAVLAGAERPGFVTPQPTEAGTLLAEVAARAEPLLGPRLRTTPPPDGTLVLVDRVRLAEALMNLLHNAAVHAHDAPVDLRLVEEVDSHRFEVADQGSGVPAGHEEAVFEPFHRGAANGDGGGLGLALVRTVAEAHGGSAGIDNRPGRGVTFWVRVPR